MRGGTEGAARSWDCCLASALAGRPCPHLPESDLGWKAEAAILLSGGSERCVSASAPPGKGYPASAVGSPGVSTPLPQTQGRPGGEGQGLNSRKCRSPGVRVCAHRYVGVLSICTLGCECVQGVKVHVCMCMCDTVWMWAHVYVCTWAYIHMCNTL